MACFQQKQQKVLYHLNPILPGPQVYSFGPCHVYAMLGTSGLNINKDISDEVEAIINFLIFKLVQAFLIYRMLTI